MVLYKKLYSRNLRSLIVHIYIISDTIQHCLHLKIVVENMWDGWPCGGCVHMANVCKENISEVIKSVHKPLYYWMIAVKEKTL